MDTLQSLYTQNKSAINLIGLVLAFFVVAGFLTTWAQQKSGMTPPYGPNEGFQDEKEQRSNPNFFPYLSEGYYTIRGSRNSEYCSDDTTGLICNRNFVKDWEKFYIKPLGENVYAIRGGRSGQWCRVTPTGLVCDADNYQNAETHFKIHGLGRGNQYGVRSVLSETHPMWCADYGNGLRCDHRDYNSFEVFLFDKVSADFEGGDEKRW